MNNVALMGVANSTFSGNSVTDATGQGGGIFNAYNSHGKSR